MNKPNRDLLKQRLLFEYSQADDFGQDMTVIQLFGFVRNGKVTELASLLHGRPEKELKALLSCKDIHGRTPLLVACYLNFSNIVLFLMHKGADPFVVDYNNIGIMHILLDQGNYESLVVILNYLYFNFREAIDAKLKRIQKEYNMKRSDVRLGKLVSPDQHIPNVRKAFEEFSAHVSSLYSNYLNEVGCPSPS
jgi:ankyrin repeat protein